MPAEAQMAGFTTLALNYDFSLPLYATQSNYLDCTLTNRSLPWHWGGPFDNSLQGPCASVFQTMDSGVAVLDIKWLNSYDVNHPNLIMYNAIDSTHYIDFPNAYVETVMRTSGPIVAGGVPSVMDSVWWGQGAGGVLYGSDVEVDVVEENSGAFGISDQNVITHNNGAICCGANWGDGAAGDITQYHKFGFLWTSNGVTANYGCGWIDDVFKGCKQVTQANSSAVGVGLFLTRQYLIMDNSCYGGPPSCQAGNQSSSAQTTDAFFKYVRVWSCANWALPVGSAPTPATMCNGSTLINGSDGSTYWH